MKADLRSEHQWLGRLVGEWEFEVEAVMEPGAPPVKHAGTETVRSLDGAWVLCEGRGEMPGGGTGTTLMTLGYDPARQRYVGTFIGSMMTHMWVYEGELDAAGTRLVLNTEGPSFTAEGRMAKYRDAIELRSDDHRVLTSSVLGDDGAWHQFMEANYRRTA